MSSWFPTGKEDNRGWRLDIVSLLAVIGESSMEEHSQVITASWLSTLPRIIPAPQALLKPARPTRLPSINASVYGLHNGNRFDQLNYFPCLIHPVNELPPYAFQVYKIQRNNSNKRVRTFHESEDEKGETLSKSAARHHSNSIKPPPHVPASTFSPLNVLNVLSFLLTIGLLIWALLIQDGVACLALFTISMASSIVGLASKWTPTLMERTSKTKDVPPGDVVIRTREGAIVVVKCDEEIARELYNGTEECEYFVGPKPYRGLVGVGTVLVMVSVILLGNCSWTMQAAIGIAYVVLNGLFWGAALIPKSAAWDLSLYKVDKITPIDAREAENTQRLGDPEGEVSFTRTLWYAIRETGDVGWVYETGAAPKTKAWDRWLAQAKNQIDSGNRNWHAVEAKDKLFVGDDVVELRGHGGEKVVLSLPGKERAPACVPPPQSTK